MLESPDINAKFLKFRQAYEDALVWLADAPGGPQLRERSALEAARKSVVASDLEIDVFMKMLQDEIPKPEA